MATIKIERGKFAVEFDARGKNGKDAHFRSFYSRSGKPLRIRVPDRRGLMARYGYRWRNRERSKIRQGIYDSLSLGPYLVFIDKLKTEAEVYVNWRTKPARSYRRVALGQPVFPSYLPKPCPSISDLFLFGGRFFIAWMRPRQKSADLVLTSIDAKTASRCDQVIAPKVGFVTLVSLAHIGSHGLIVCHRAMFGGQDAKIFVFPAKLRSTAQPTD